MGVNEWISPLKNAVCFNLVGTSSESGYPTAEWVLALSARSRGIIISGLETFICKCGKSICFVWQTKAFKFLQSWRNFLFISSAELSIMQWPSPKTSYTKRSMQIRLYIDVL